MWNGVAVLTSAIVKSSPADEIALMPVNGVGRTDHQSQSDKFDLAFCTRTFDQHRTNHVLLDLQSTQQTSNAYTKVGRGFRPVSSSGNPVVPLIPSLHRLELEFLETCGLKTATMIKAEFKLRVSCDSMGWTFILP